MSDSQRVAIIPYKGRMVVGRNRAIVFRRHCQGRAVYNLRQAVFIQL
ncbi:MAG: hypothetical protein MZV63_13905 [Marinilabiliales bacterium]|nr:hypothetical protein [Marinilabiliales bacterium]